MAWLELARQLHEPFRMNKEALLCLDRSLALAPGMAGAALLAGLVNLDLGRNQEALAALKLAESDGESAAEREHCRGDAFHNLGRLKESQAAYQGCLQLIGHDPQIESKLGYVEVKLGDRSGFLRIQNALAALPLGAELHERLIKAYLTAGMLPEAADAAEKFASILMHPKTVLRAAAIRSHLKQDEQARSLIVRGLQYFPESDELKHAQAELAGAGKP
jgi:tetratricopeptide (TPR) repeat protein